jgi:hypothetical protein
VTSVDDEATLLVERKQLESARQRLCLAAMQLQDQLSIVTASVQLVLLLLRLVVESHTNVRENLFHFVRKLSNITMALT